MHLQGRELLTDLIEALSKVAGRLKTIGADHRVREAVKQLQNAGILRTVTLADVVVEAYKHNLLTCRPESGVRTPAPHSGVQG